MVRRAAVVVLALGLVACTDPVTPPRDASLSRTASGASTVTLVAFFNQQFVRTTGAPNQYSVAISTAGYQAPFEIHIRNGSAAGTNRVSSAWVTLDGTQLLGPSDFSQQASEWSFPATLGAVALLDVKVASKPGSYLEITISGTPAAALFCPAGGPGAYLDLPSAVAATDSGGTILVCDGFWEVNQDTIDKPLTLRSQNPGGATLSDTNAGPLGQGGIPGIVVDGYAAGTVRFVDLSFSVRSRMIIADGTFDRIEVDSTTWLGTDPTAFMFEPFSSTVATAFVEVKNSRFDGGSVAVFPVRGVEANVHHNLFENQRISGVIHSGNGLGGTSFAHGRVEDNVFRNCGPDVCVRSFARDIVIARNRIEVPTGVSRLFGGIQLTRQTINAPSLTTVVIEDNEIIGGALPGAPSAPTSWTIQAGIRVSAGSPFTPFLIRRNAITDAHTHFIVQPNIPLTATDNTAIGGFFAISNASAVSVYNRNDFVGLGASFPNVGITPAANIRCNWWGSAAGPVAPPIALPPAVYTPFSTAPIANQPSVACP